MLTALADRLGSRPRRVLLAVLAFVLVAGVFGGPVAGTLDESGGFLPERSDSRVAVERLAGATGLAPAPGIVLLVDTPRGVAASGERIAAITEQLADVPGIREVASTVTTRGDPAFTSTDGRRTFVAGTLAADASEDVVAETVVERFGAVDGVTAGGQVLSEKQVGDRIGEDLGRAELIAFPILVLLSLLFFRGRAALMPLVVGVTTVLGTFLALAAINQFFSLSVFALNLTIGLGLGLAIDYTLFLVSRYREELARQGPTPGAIRVTMQTAGRTVVFSSLTVACALITLTVFPLGFLQSMGIAGATVALVAAAAALVISPALFALWGAKLAVRRRRAARPAQQGGWYRISHAVMRRPGAVAAVTALVMILLTLPSLRTVWTPIDATVIPKGESARTVADTLERDFPAQGTNPLTVAIAASPQDRDGVERYAAAVAALDGVRDVTAPRLLGFDTWQLDVEAEGAPEGPVAQRLVEEVRGVPASFDARVTGAAAEFVDQQEAIGSRLLLAIGLLMGLTFVVLWLMTGSIVLPLKAIVMNALTVGSALGVLTLIYQDGRLEGFLGYTGNGGIEPSDFLVTSALVFALSTDYGVFLLGRIKEARDAGESEREAVAVGLERTGGVVTAAAILLAVAIGAFSTSSISFIQQIGVATATGVLVDAFIVRTFLVPALMALLGKWNWWSPMLLRRVHDRIGLREGDLAAATRA